jgi:mRNA interferase RelE/StbE
MAYQVEITPAAQRTIKKLSKNVQRKIIETIEKLANEPRPVGVVKLSATENLYRVRTGDYRIIYEIQDKILLIVITKVGHRRDVYK